MKITFANDADDMMLTMIDSLSLLGIVVQVTYTMPPTRAFFCVEGTIKSRNEEELIVVKFESNPGDEDISIPLANITQIEVQ